MVLKFVIADKDGKSWKVDSEAEFLMGKNIGDKFLGKELKPELEGYEFEITGGSDSSGFPLSKNVEGIGLKKMLLTKGFGMRDTYPGIRRRKTLRGKTIANTAAQINAKIIKAGAKGMAEIFPEQNKPKEKAPKEKKSAAETPK